VNEAPPGKLPPSSGTNLTYCHRIGNIGIAVLDMRSERTRERVMSTKA
jgi:hypothetical protein